MTKQDYITKRLDDQYHWYAARAKHNQKCYRFLKVMSIVIAITLPLCAGYSEQMPLLKWCMGIGGALIALIEGLQSLYKYHENWLQYRQTAESLNREKIYFETNSGVYRNDDSLQLLVERIEAICSSENTHWGESMSDKSTT